MSFAAKRRLGELLVDAQVLDQTKLQAALAEQRRWGGKLGRILVDMGFVDEKTMVVVLAQQLNLKTVDLDAAKLPPQVVELLRLDLAERYGVFPVAVDAKARALHVAMSEPTNRDAIGDLEFATGFNIVPVVSTGSSIDRAIRRYYFGDNAVSPAVRATAVGAKLPRPPPPAVEEHRAPVPPPPPPPSPAVSAAPPPQPPPPQSTPARETAATLDALLNPPKPDLAREVAILKEQVAELEHISATQVRALRSLLEILIAAGLIDRDEYLQRLHPPE